MAIVGASSFSTTINGFGGKNEPPTSPPDCPGLGAARTSRPTRQLTAPKRSCAREVVGPGCGSKI